VLCEPTARFEGANVGIFGPGDACRNRIVEWGTRLLEDPKEDETCERSVHPNDGGRAGERVCGVAAATAESDQSGTLSVLV
jgi:hypothetical protein